MKPGAWIGYPLLLAGVTAAALAGRASAPARSPVPSLDNPGPLGARALARYLTESGHTVLPLMEPLTELPAQLRTLVIASPAGRDLAPEERAALDRWVRAGGRLVYLSPRPPQQRPELAGWLGISPGSSWMSSEDRGAPADQRGRSVRVTLAAGAAAGVNRLRLSAGGSVQVEEALPVAEGGALWWKGLGIGEVWIGAGPDLLENRRLELLDNLQLWENLAAAGPIGFAEQLHLLPAPPPLSLALWGIGAQLLLLAGVLFWSRSRMGPPRPLPGARHRSSLEYVTSLAWLTRRARVEGELLAEALTRLRALLHERLGISVELPDPEAALEVERLCGLPAAPLASSLAKVRAAVTQPLSPRDYARWIRALARVERVICGRGPPPEGASGEPRTET